MSRVRIFFFSLTALFVAFVGFFVIQFASGYRFDFANLSFEPTGLLVATSTPDGAQVFVNGELKTATNATINLSPGTYDVEIRREGFLAWRKRLTLFAEIVTKTDAVLFPQAPSLAALTFSGTSSPVLSPDATKLAFSVPLTSETRDRAGLWVLDLSELPLGFSREPRRVTDGNLAGVSWEWSPDSRQILLSSARGTFLLEAGSFTPQANLVNITEASLAALQEDWDQLRQTRLTSKLSRLPEALQEILERKAEKISFSPDETKILYTATQDADIPDELIPPVPGASTQRQERNIKEGKTYIYDIKEDRSFAVGRLGEEEAALWFPTSRHLILAQSSKVTIMDYDGTNRQEVWSGPYVAPHAYAFANATRLVVLTNLGASNGGLANLYALSLR